jgi:hypothetical protein
MGQTTSKPKNGNNKALPSLGRFSKLQIDMRKIYKNQNPAKTRAELTAWSATLSNESVIQAVLAGFERDVFGVNADGTPVVTGDNNLVFRVDRLIRKLKL